MLFTSLGQVLRMLGDGPDVGGIAIISAGVLVMAVAVFRLRRTRAG